MLINENRANKTETNSIPFKFSFTQFNYLCACVRVRVQKQYIYTPCALVGLPVRCHCLCSISSHGQRHRSANLYRMIPWIRQCYAASAFSIASLSVAAPISCMCWCAWSFCGCFDSHLLVLKFTQFFSHSLIFPSIFKFFAIFFVVILCFAKFMLWRFTRPYK